MARFSAAKDAETVWDEKGTDFDRNDMGCLAFAYASVSLSVINTFAGASSSNRLLCVDRYLYGICLLKNKEYLDLHSNSFPE